MIYTVDRNTEVGLEPFLHWVRDTKLPVMGVMVYFHTPYYGIDELYLDAEERAAVIDRLVQARGAASHQLERGTQSAQSGKWPRRLPVALVADIDGESLCCRRPTSVRDCGYGPCTEIAEAQRLRPSAVLGMVRYL